MRSLVLYEHATSITFCLRKTPTYSVFRKGDVHPILNRVQYIYCELSYNFTLFLKTIFSLYCTCNSYSTKKRAPTDSLLIITLRIKFCSFYSISSCILRICVREYLVKISIGKRRNSSAYSVYGPNICDFYTLYLRYVSCLKSNYWQRNVKPCSVFRFFFFFFCFCFCFYFVFQKMFLICSELFLVASIPNRYHIQLLMLQKRIRSRLGAFETKYHSI